MKSVYSAVRTGSLNKAVCASSLMAWITHTHAKKGRHFINTSLHRCRMPHICRNYRQTVSSEQWWSLSAVRQICIYSKNNVFTGNNILNCRYGYRNYNGWLVIQLAHDNSTDLKGSIFNNQQNALINQTYTFIKLYMFRVSSLPIIRSFLLYNRHS